MKKILILGGTQFIGRTLVAQLLKLNKFDITLFNRQKTQADLFPTVKKIKGDRETNDIRKIEHENWDYIIDVSCYYPDSLSNVLDCIKGKLKKYILISTCSVYDDENDQTPMRTESGKILSCTKEQRVDRTNTSYGNRKAECEHILINSNQAYTIFRPSLVYGPYDHTDRFYYWLYQVKHTKTVLLPDFGEKLFSITYVVDLVHAIINTVESNISGIYNVTTAVKTSIKEIVEYAEKWLHETVEKVNASPDFLYKNNVRQWADMPLWLDGDYFSYDNQQLKKDFNFELTNYEKSIKDTISYYDSLGWKKPIYGITEQRKQELIDTVRFLSSQE
ncbi:NAD-dependent epimerase/dehydratase family protein [Kordia sp.]|uniref:NAD-dependent epimerase/dehydratase family protein n=1 Tax=Kordia sp. TaxID=1965332 RepID=UPI003D2DB9A9